MCAAALTLVLSGAAAFADDPPVAPPAQDAAATKKTEDKKDAKDQKPAAPVVQPEQKAPEAKDSFRAPPVDVKAARAEREALGVGFDTGRGRDLLGRLPADEVEDRLGDEAKRARARHEQNARDLANVERKDDQKGNERNLARFQGAAREGRTARLLDRAGDQKHRDLHTLYEDQKAIERLVQKQFSKEDKFAKVEESTDYKKQQKKREEFSKERGMRLKELASERELERQELIQELRQERAEQAWEAKNEAALDKKKP
ncbi:MAG TPA: hypothetical protein VFF73_21525 [Planctomycetota bacterium]|nr:hypothetical protein [Planctomycetota bacterium]